MICLKIVLRFAALQKLTCLLLQKLNVSTFANHKLLSLSDEKIIITGELALTTKTAKFTCGNYGIDGKAQKSRQQLFQLLNKFFIINLPLY
jgi:hypothetical protein